MRTLRVAAPMLLAAAMLWPADAARPRSAKPVKVAQGGDVISPLPPPPTTAPSLTLADALALAYETNPQLKAQQAALRATDESVAIANGAWRPQISAGGTYAYQQYYFNPITVTDPNTGATFGPISTVSAHPLQGAVTVTQPIFRGGRTVAEISRAKALVRAGRAQLLAAEQTVLLSAATAYMDVVRDEAILRLRQHNVEVLKKQADAVQAQFSAGALTRTDVAQAQARLADAQSSLTAALSQLQISRATFLQAIGREAETLEYEPGLPSALPVSMDASIVLAMRQNPAIVQARESEVAANYAVDDAVGALLPTFSVQGQYGLSQGALVSPFGTFNAGPSGSTTHAMTVTGQLNVPIYQGGAEEAAVRQAKELYAQAQFTTATTDRQVREAMASAWALFQAAQAAIVSNEASEHANEVAFTGVSREQQVGARTVLDVLNAEQELLNSAVAVVTAKRNAEVAAFQVLAAAGALTAKNLGLKVTLYDPVVHYDEDAAKWFGLGD